MNQNKIKKICAEHSDECFIMKSITDSNEIYEFYDSYRLSDNIPEFLYLPELSEVDDDLSRGMIYLGLINKSNEIIAMIEVFLLELLDGNTYEFHRYSNRFASFAFYPPDWDRSLSDKYFAASGLYVKDDYRGNGLGVKLIQASIKIAQGENARGIYGDPHYKNIASQCVVSEMFNIIGFTDGTESGVKNEESLYITYYHSIFNNPPKIDATLLSVADLNVFDAKEKLSESMDRVGKMSVYNRAYKDGTNKIYVLDDTVFCSRTFSY